MADNSDRPHFAHARQHMVQTQLEGRNIRNAKVLAAFSRVLRHCFIPPSERDLAYADHPLSIGAHQTISQPYVVAYMVQTLNLHQDDRVLEIGTGSGYQTAILAELVASVHSIEFFPELARQARRVLEDLGYSNVQYQVGDGARGWSENAPFDAIIGSAATPEVPAALIEQLAIGGRMILPLGNYRQHLVLIGRTEDRIERQSLIPVRFVPMQTG